MIQLDETMRQLANNAAAVRALLENISDQQAQWKPSPETWSLMEVMEHVYNEERIDFRKHLKEMFSSPPQPWDAYHPEDYVGVESCRQALELFMAEREDSIAWLRTLISPDWDAASEANFGPAADVLVLSAGDVLVSWLAHDHLHIRQINELLFAWNEQRAAPYSVQYAGGW